MNRSILLALALSLAAWLCGANPVSAQDDIQRDFRIPPEAAKPMTWWHWMNGNVTKEGITADLEAMKRIGYPNLDLRHLYRLSSEATVSDAG